MIYFLFSLSLLMFCPSMQARDKIAEGKTKIIWTHDEDAQLVIVESKNDITAGNKARHDIMLGKAELANLTACNVFRLLQACGIPVAFKEQIDANKFLAPRCDMIHLEVVARRAAHGSYEKRNPIMKKDHYLPRLEVEFFLKTSDCIWEGQTIPVDDPLMQFKDGKVYLYLPNVPLSAQKPFMILDMFPLSDNLALYNTIDEITCRTFLILEKAWQLVGGRLVDFKIEFGFDTLGNLLLADVIDNDSWRVIYDDNYIDKQVYRDGGSLDKVIALYQRVADLTSQFRIPNQQIILWRGSEKDDLQIFKQAFESFAGYGCTLQEVTKSAHKEPVACYLQAHKLVQSKADSVVIAYVGASNAAGPMISANVSVPVITVPADKQQISQDVWSSLRMPSNSLVMTMLDPRNAMLAGLQILSMRNPALYSLLRYEQEKRLMNIISLS